MWFSVIIHHKLYIFKKEFTHFCHANSLSCSFLLDWAPTVFEEISNITFRAEKSNVLEYIVKKISFKKKGSSRYICKT